MGFSDFLSGLIGDTPTNRSAESINIARANQSRMLEEQYNAASADPNSGVGLSPAMQAMQENELANSVRSRMSDAGAGRSSAANAGVQKAIVDYRIAQMAQRQRYLDSLRTGMLNASSPQTVQPSLPQTMVSRFGTQAAGSLANDMFDGSSDEAERNRRGGMGVNAPTSAPPVYPSTGTTGTGQSPNDPNQYRSGGV